MSHKLQLLAEMNDFIPFASSGRLAKSNKLVLESFLPPNTFRALGTNIKPEKMNKSKRSNTQEDLNRNIEVFGLSNDADRNLNSYIKRIAQNIGFDLLENDIENVTRSRPRKDKTPSTVIIKMTTKQRKDEFLKFLLSNENVLKRVYNPNLQFRDHLTAKNRELLKETREFAMENDFHMWVEDGCIYVQKNVNSEKIKILRKKHLKKMRQPAGSVRKEKDDSKNSNEATSDSDEGGTDVGNQYDKENTTKVNNNDIEVPRNNATASRNLSKATKKKLIMQEDLLRDIEVFGLPEEAYQDIKSYIEELSKKVKFRLKEDDIECIKRGPPRRNNQPSTVIITMKTMESKECFIKKNLSYNSKRGGCIRFNDHLTPENKRLLREARLAAKQLKFIAVWTKNGEIFTRQSKETEIIQIKDLKDIENKMHKLNIVS